MPRGSECLGKRQSRRARLDVAEGGRKEIPQSAREDAAFVRNIVDEEIDCPGAVLRPSAQIDLGIGGQILSWIGRKRTALLRPRKDAQPVADVAYRCTDETGDAARQRKSLIDRDISDHGLLN